jgi:hypothetical protein
LTGVPSSTPQQAALGALLAGAVDGVLQAQRQLDTDASQRLVDFIDTPQGGLALPPLWYTLSEVRIELEVAASITRLQARTATGGAVRLNARLLNPTAVGLFGYSASSGLRVQLCLSPRDSSSSVPPVIAPVPLVPAPAAPT